MGYGAGMEVTLNCNSGHVLYNGRNLVITPEIESWDLVGDVNSMRDIKPELLKISFNRIVLTQENRNWFKEEGIQKGDAIYFRWDKKLHGHLWSGYCRSSLNMSFPIELKGVIDMDYAGTFEVTAMVNMSNKDEFKIFIDDILDYYPDDESCREYIDGSEGRLTDIEDARMELYETNNDNNRANYGA